MDHRRALVLSGARLVIVRCVWNRSRQGPNNESQLRRGNQDLSPPTAESLGCARAYKSIVVGSWIGRGRRLQAIEKVTFPHPSSPRCLLSSLPSGGTLMCQKRPTRGPIVARSFRQSGQSARASAISESQSLFLSQRADRSSSSSDQTRPGPSGNTHRS